MLNFLKSMLQKVIQGDPYRITRFHDQKGNLVSLGSLLYLPLLLISNLARVVFGYRPVLPWIPFKAIRVIDSLLQKDWQVLEFGSGMSTCWLAVRCACLYSIEDNSAWYDKVTQLIQQRKITNVKYMLKTREDYTLLTDYPDQFFDFILIDGSDRINCVKVALEKVKPSGFIYLDNTDVSGNMRIAEEILLEAVKRKKGQFTYFTDFVPAHGTANQGLLVKL